ncbi:hypothetical protein F4777DRAFT_72900 [Nemania sp. FL0916]|nr:hypothetical protein F4777DRAFT_72900 [Nemania sp. FL0916]
MAMGSQTTTLRRLLTQPKPIVPCKIKSGKNTKGGWPKFGAHTITIWDDFCLETLNESYGHMLDLEMPATQWAKLPRPEILNGIEITKMNDVLHLVGWNDKMLQPTLGWAKRHFHLHDGLLLQHRVVAPDNRSSKILFRQGADKAQVDHIVALDDFQLPSLIMGLGRPSVKFRGRMIANNPEAATQENLWPLRQLANMCKLAETRYGYIITDEDLVACCFYCRATHGNDDVLWDVALMPVPWTRQGTSQLTTDLALWWLGMLALSAPENRALKPEANVVPIKEWETRYIDEQRGWVRRHRYSHIEKPTDPPPPPAYQDPSLENAAAFEAAIGLHANEWFNLYDAGDAGEEGNVGNFFDL